MCGGRKQLLLSFCARHSNADMDMVPDFLVARVIIESLVLRYILVISQTLFKNKCTTFYSSVCFSGHLDLEEWTGGEDKNSN